MTKIQELINYYDKESHSYDGSWKVWTSRCLGPHFSPSEFGHFYHFNTCGIWKPTPLWLRSVHTQILGVRQLFGGTRLSADANGVSDSFIITGCPVGSTSASHQCSTRTCNKSGDRRIENWISDEAAPNESGAPETHIRRSAARQKRTSHWKSTGVVPGKALPTLITYVVKITLETSERLRSRFLMEFSTSNQVSEENSQAAESLHRYQNI